MDGGYRAKDYMQQTHQALLRTGLSYTLTPGIRITAGIAAVGYFASDKLSETEYRFYQDIQEQKRIQGINLEQRLRIEQRFFRTGADKQASVRNFNWRFRYKLGGAIPLAALGLKNLSWYIGDEIFINAGNEIMYNTFDQNRFLTGCVFQGSEHLSCSLLYNHNFSADNKPQTFRQNHILWLSVNNRFKIRKTNPHKSKSAKT